MHVVVVFESMFGNTHAIAEAIGEGLLAAGHTADVVPVDDAGSARIASAQAIVVGGPTHAHGMTSARTREAAADEVGKVAAKVADGEADEELHLDEHATGEGLRDWFHHLAEGGSRPAVAFDTRVHVSPLLSGSAARGIARRLRHDGWDVVVDPESFFVTGNGPLVDGEVERASQFGKQLGERLADA